MPTGYTEKLYDGEQEFEDFALRAARAFGALVEMRDSGLDATIPDEFVASAYHQEHRDEAVARRVELLALSPAAAAREAEAEADRWDAERKASAAETNARRSRYEAMRERVLAWHPPTRDGAEWRAEQIAKAERDIAYHDDEHTKERARAATRTAWVRALRDSLTPVAAIANLRSDGETHG